MAEDSACGGGGGDAGAACEGEWRGIGVMGMRAWRRGDAAG